MTDPRAAGRLRRRVERTIAEHGMLTGGERLLVAISGGPDSVATLAVLRELAPKRRLTLVAAHLNHHLRGPSSDRDEEFVRGLCRSLDVALHVGSAALGAEAANLEARARRARYRFLEELANRLDCQRIVTGHNLDDQSETVIMRLLRGAGSRGLAGILPIRGGRIVRPLIDCPRSWILEYLRDRGLSFCSDASNDDLRFTRNRIRHQILPLLETINPAYRRALGRAARIASCESELIDMICRQHLEQVSSTDGGLSAAAFRALPVGVQPLVLNAWLESLPARRIDAAHVDSLLRLLRSGAANGHIDLPGSARVDLAYDSLRLSVPGVDPGPPVAVPLESGSLTTTAGWRFEFRVAAGAGSGEHLRAGPWSYVADAGLLRDPLQLRPVRAGDRLIPFGMESSRKLQDVFVDRKVPRLERWGRPALAAGDLLLWVPGVVRSNHAPVGADTRSLFLAQVAR